MLTFGQYAALSETERLARYDELSDEDKYRARVTEIRGDGPGAAGTLWEPTDKDIQDAMEIATAPVDDM